MKYLAIKINEFITPMNNADELGGLIDCNVDFEILGTICDNEIFGDNCKKCMKQNECNARIIKDSNENYWHIINNK